MFVCVINRKKGKLLFFILLIILCFTVFILSNYFINNKPTVKITVEDIFCFSCPLSFTFDSIYVNNKLAEHKSIKTGINLCNPFSRQFTTYKSLEGNFSFKYPSAFSLNEKKFNGSDILYHIDFKNDSKKSHGFVQVWNLPFSLKKFLQNSKNTSLQNYKYFNSKNVKVNGILGYHWDYVVKGSNGLFYKGSEIFLKSNKKMYRISYFVPEQLWNDKEKIIFNKMVNSFKILQQNDT